MNKRVVLTLVVVVLMACGAAFVGRRMSASSSNEQPERSVNPKALISNAVCSGDNRTVARNEEPGGREDSADKQEAVETAEEEPQTEEEKREAEEEKKIDAFDNLTDKWMEPSVKGVTMADVDNFAKAFRQVPKARQDECIHRALNLIPDENVMLLAGVLMNKAMDKEIVETVYNGILNRDKDVKRQFA